MNPDDFKGPPQAPYAYPPVLALIGDTALALLPEHVHDIFVPGRSCSSSCSSPRRGPRQVSGCSTGPATGAATRSRFLAHGHARGVRVRGDRAGPAPPDRRRLALPRPRADRRRRRAGGAVVLKLFLWPLLDLARAHPAPPYSRGWRLPPLAVGLAPSHRGSSSGSAASASTRGCSAGSADVEAENSYSVFAILRTLRVLGGRGPAARPVALGALVLALGVARRSRARASPSSSATAWSLTLILAAALVLTPILWLHYLVLLYIPIALARPRLSALWFAPLHSPCSRRSTGTGLAGGRRQGARQRCGVHRNRLRRRVTARRRNRKPRRGCCTGRDSLTCH